MHFRQFLFSIVHIAVPPYFLLLPIQSDPFGRSVKSADVPCSVIENVEVVGTHLLHATVLIVLHAGKGSGESVLLPTVAVVRHATFHCFIDFAEIAEGDEFLERVFTLGKHPARAVKGDVVGIICSVEDPLGEVLYFRQLQ